MGRIRPTRHDAVQMGAVDGTLAAAETLVVAGHLEPGMMDADLVVAHHHADLGADQPPRHAVMVGVHVHAGIGLYSPGQFAELAEWRPAEERP